MKALFSWLREYVDIPVEPRHLGADLTLVGFALDGLEMHGQDAVLDLDVTTNRVDAMNMYGLAREIAVIYGLPLKPLALSLSEKGRPASEALDVTIEAPELCPRFSARVLDVRLGPSPAWIRDRLQAVGVRPIHNVVDLTNYVLMEMGHPSHAFDQARIPAGRLNVRWAREGERLQTLDGVERTLSARQGVVAGPDAALALAGIMGGATSEVSDETTVVALEAAYWDPLSVRRTAKALGMHTEASHRFERGADPEATVTALARIAHLLEMIGAGSARPGVIDRVARPLPRRTLSLRPARLALVLGTPVPPAKVEQILAGLGFGLAVAKDALTVEVPSWRSDVSREADLVEEVGRHFGLDQVPSAIPPSAAVGSLGPGQAEERVLRSALVGAGLTEVITYAFVGAGDGSGVALENPLAEAQAVLRPSLLGGLLEVLDTNVRQGRRDVAIFEVGRVFAPSQELPVEERRLGILLAGHLRLGHWSEGARAADFFDLKGLLERLFERLGLAVPVLGTEGLPSFLHPGRSAVVTHAGKPVGWLGALRPGFRQEAEGVLVAELDLAALVGTPAPLVRFMPLGHFPAVERDLSVLAGAETSAAEVQDRIRRAAGPLLVAAEVKDRYDRPPVPSGRVSLTLSLRYQHPERTLLGEEVQASVESVVADLRAAGLEIRGE